MKSKIIIKVFFVFFILFVCVGCSGEYTSYDYEVMIEELEAELEYKTEQISILEDKLRDCEDHYYECFTEAKYCGCLDNISKYDYYDFEK